MEEGSIENSSLSNLVIFSFKGSFTLILYGFCLQELKQVNIKKSTAASAINPVICLLIFVLFNDGYSKCKNIKNTGYLNRLIKFLIFAMKLTKKTKKMPVLFSILA
jgi:hypothetical protein